MSKPTAFRTDIAGLRAWAVLAVVLFHFNIPGFSGGFVGVDIFFAISGYLMTQIIIRGLEGGQFSLWGFYLARVRRIVPALLILCAVLLALGWWVLPPADYRTLGMHVLTSVLFASNIQYWREAGYFDAASHEKWLLHTWSLSVEWQFYLVLPLLLWGIWKVWPGRRNAARVLIALLLASFALSIWLTSQKPETAFFLLPTRAWEMLAGALVALYSGGATSRMRSGYQRAFEGLGFAMMALSVTTANPANWPGAAALLPVLGTVLVLLAQRQNSVLTAPPVMQRVGDWSYSIYLWHWPVAVGLVYIGWQNEAGGVIAGLGLSLVLGWLSFRWVEPLGRKLLVGSHTVPAIGFFALAVLLVAVPAFGVRKLEGLPGRLSPEVEAIAAAAYDHNPLRNESHSVGGMVFKKHVYGGTNIRAIVWGDSHASTLVTAVQAALPAPQDGVLGMSYTSCPTVLNVRQERKDLHCAEFNEWALQQMAKLPVHVPVLIVNRSSAYLQGNQYGATEVNPTIYFDSTLLRLEKNSRHFLEEYTDHLVTTVCQVAQTRPVYLLRPLPEMPMDVPRAMARAAQLGRPLDVHMPLPLYHQRNAAAWAAQDRAVKECGAHLLDPLPFLCKKGICPGMDGMQPRYYDDNHVSERGSRLLKELLKSRLH